MSSMSLARSPSLSSVARAALVQDFLTDLRADSAALRELAENVIDAALRDDAGLSRANLLARLARSPLDARVLEAAENLTRAARIERFFQNVSRPFGLRSNGGPSCPAPVPSP